MRTSHRLALFAGFLFAAVSAFAQTQYSAPTDPAVVRLLTATQGPTLLFNAQSGRIARVYRETLVPVERIARPNLGLAGFWFDPAIRS